MDVSGTEKSDASQGTSPDTFGSRLKSLRESVGMTQRDLFSCAVDKDVSMGTVTAVSHWEDGRRFPVPPHLSALLRVFGERGVAVSTCWDLVEAAAGEHHRYAGFLALLPGDISCEARLSMFETWAATFPER